jgi:hypothetical protein
VAVPINVPDDQAENYAEQECKPVPTMLMLHLASEQWIASLYQRLDDKEIGEAYPGRAEGFMEHFRVIVNDSIVSEIRNPELAEIRRVVQHCPKKDGNPRMHNTVRTELGFLKDFFQWLSDKEKWLASADWRRWLRAESRNAHFDEDAEADVDKKVDVYAIEELAKVYAVAGKALRTWMCCALNFAWAQGEISSARSKHWKMQHQRVARFRGKRNPNARPVPGRWVAWPETWALTTARMAETLMDKEINPEQRAFLTRQNNRLVRVIRRRGKKPKRKDAVAEAWDIRSSLSLTADTIRRGNLRWRRKMRRLII